MIPSVRRMQIRLGSSLVTIDLSTPTNPVRWVVMPIYGPALDAAMQQAGQAFYTAQLGVMSVQMNGLRGSAAAQQLQAAMRWLRKQPEAQGLPVSYFGVDVGTAVALQAASGANDVASVLSWNGRPELAWKSLGAVRTPVLLMVDAQQNWLRTWANQAVNSYLGSVSRFEKAAGPAEMANLALEWMSQNRRGILSAPRPSLGHKLAFGVTAMALCASLATTTQASATPQTTATRPNATSPTRDQDPFSDGLVLGAGNIAGDASANLAATKSGAKVNRSKPAAGLGKKGKKGKKGSKNVPAVQEYKLDGSDVAGDVMGPLATGSGALIDGGGLKWSADTNITFSTTSDASGAMSEAEFTGPVAATTVSGMTAPTTLTDAFDGYNTLMINGTLPPATDTGVFYNKNGAPTSDCSGRQLVYAPQTVSVNATGDLTVQRKVYVPADDEFARWTNIFTNNSADPILINPVIANNLGSDANTLIVNSSNGDTTADLTDTWVTSMQNYSGATSPDVRLGHVLQGLSPQVPLSVFHFANGDDNPYWGYQLTIQPGKTAILLNFATGQPSKADAAAKAAWLSGLPAPTLLCLTSDEQAAVVNFNLATDVGLTATAQASPVFTGDALTYTVVVTNSGPNPANGVMVKGTLPTGSTYVDSSGTGWTTGESGGVVTATHDPLAPGDSATFQINIKAPPAAGTAKFSADLTIDNQDTNPANNGVVHNTTVRSRTYLPLLKK
jgi:uncharacterized repeat protein (TIGR01451 family)